MVAYLGGEEKIEEDLIAKIKQTKTASQTFCLTDEKGTTQCEDVLERTVRNEEEEEIRRRRGLVCSVDAFAALSHTGEDNHQLHLSGKTKVGVTI